MLYGNSIWKDNVLNLNKNKSLFKEDIGVLEKNSSFHNNSFCVNSQVIFIFIFLLPVHCRELGMILFEWKVAGNYNVSGTGCPNKHGNSVKNSISSLLWISIVIPNIKSHNIIMSARVYFMKRVKDCKDVSIMSFQDEQWRRTSLFFTQTVPDIHELRFLGSRTIWQCIMNILLNFT